VIFLIKRKEKKLEGMRKTKSKKKKKGSDANCNLANKHPRKKHRRTNIGLSNI